MRYRVLALLLAMPITAEAQTEVLPLEVRQLGRWQDASLHESSGVVVSRRHPGILWMHNDSGDGPILYATDTTGALRASFTVVGARNVDWEDIALGTCPPGSWADRQCLFIGDTGDNDQRRSRVVLYAVPEPDPSESGRGIPTEPARTLRIRYPGGPADAEALAALPDGRLEIITKGRSGVVLRFEIPADAWGAEEFLPGPADTLPIQPQLLAGRWVTGAATAPNGSEVVVRTYTEMYWFAVGRRWKLARPICRFGLVEPQGESVDFRDASELILTSETARGQTGGVVLLRCP